MHAKYVEHGALLLIKTNSDSNRWPVVARFKFKILGIRGSELSAASTSLKGVKLEIYFAFAVQRTC